MGKKLTNNPVKHWFTQNIICLFLFVYTIDY